MITRKRKFGNVGEDIAVRFLVKHGFSVVERNYLRKTGEIDIICRKKGIIHFIEVKTVSRETVVANVSRETDLHRPEDNISPTKQRRLKKTISIYLAEHNLDEFEFHAILVVIDEINKTARVKMLKNIIL